uniref:Uncharacterized protein n=1 Tax=Caenorhabditis tropicalis TaxID=1561998 RepID=A0A1I7TWR8_9PELO
MNTPRLIKKRMTMSQLHQSISPIDLSILKSDQPLRMTEAERQWRHSENEGPEDNVRVRIQNVTLENKEEDKNRKCEEIIDVCDFFIENHHDLVDIIYRKRVASKRIKRMIILFVNYMEHEFRKNPKRAIPAFPKIFHRAVVDVVFEILCQFKLVTETSKIYTAVQNCVNSLEDFPFVPFDHFVTRMAADDPVWRLPYTDTQETLRRLSTDKFTDSFFD